MGVSIKRLGPGDEAILELLLKDDADFDLTGRVAARAPLKPSVAQRYLANPSVLHWIALEDSVVTGFLSCSLLLLRADPGHELVLSEMGVRKVWRSKGVGRALLTHMEIWMRNNDVLEVWVRADNQGAVDFYRSCAFTSVEPQPLYLTRKVEPGFKKAASTLISG